MKLNYGVLAGVVSYGLAVLGAPPAGEQLSLQQLVDKVSGQVRQELPGAKLVVAAGTAPGGRTRDPRQVTDWRLVFDIFEHQSSVKSVEVEAKLDGTVGRQVRRDTLWMGVTIIQGRLPMSPAEAYRALDAAGHHEAYQYLSLVEPLIPNSHLQYHFSNTAGGCDGYSVNADDRAVESLCD